MLLVNLRNMLGPQSPRWCGLARLGCRGLKKQLETGQLKSGWVKFKIVRLFKTNYIKNVKN
jgi:hypothetical protein